jgi:hypothetical protein
MDQQKIWKQTRDARQRIATLKDMKKSKHSRETLLSRRLGSRNDNFESSTALNVKRFYRGWANASLCAHCPAPRTERLGRGLSHYYIDCQAQTHWADTTGLTTDKSSPSGVYSDRGFTDKTKDAAATGMMNLAVE